MRSITELNNAQKWLEEYANTPLITPSLEEARKKLINLGIILYNEEISPQFKGIICKKGKK